jgi:tetratricopeptide (TPR) repeat protein
VRISGLNFFILIFFLTSTCFVFAEAVIIPGTSIFVTPPPLWIVNTGDQNIAMSFSPDKAGTSADKGGQIELKVYPFSIASSHVTTVNSDDSGVNSDVSTVSSDVSQVDAVKESLDGWVSGLDKDLSSKGRLWYRIKDVYETVGGDFLRLVLYKDRAKNDKGAANEGAGRLAYLFRYYDKSLLVLKWGGKKDSYKSIERILLSCGRSVGIKGLSDLEAFENKLILQCKADPSNITLQSELARVRAGIADFHNSAGDLDLAASYLMSANKLEPGNSEYLEKLGDSLQFLTSPMAPHAAAAYYEEALAANPSKRTLRIKLATTLGATGEYFDAMEQFQILTRNGGNKPDDTYIQELAVIWAQLNLQEQGIAFCREMRKLGGGERFTVTEAILTRGQGNLSDAVKLLEEALQSPTIDPALLSYGKALLQRYKQSTYGRVD